MYDYETDPGENKNLANDKPEVVAELKAILAKQPPAKPQIHPNGAPKPNAAKQQTGATKKNQGKKWEDEDATG